MVAKKNDPLTSIDQYIAAQPEAVRPLLAKVRAAIRAGAPKASESIKYRIAAYEQDGHLIFFAAFKSHIGVYPRAQGPASLLARTAKYEAAKGTYRFTLDEPVPYALITAITKARVRENAALARARGAKKAKKRAAETTATRKG